MTKLKWTSTSQYVDIDTGEIISKQNAEQNYIITKKTKHVLRTNANWATNEWTIQCRKRKQPIAKQTNLWRNTGR